MKKALRNLIFVCLVVLNFKSAFAQPSNDACANAISLTSGTTCNYTSGTTIGATQSLTAGCGNGDDDVWYSFVAQATTHTITVLETGDFDAVIEGRTGACMGSMLVCFSSNSNGGIEFGDFDNLIIGTTYFLRVYHDLPGSSTGSFKICVTHTSGGFSAPSNDACASAKSLTSSNTCNYTPGTTIGATQSLTTGCGNGDDDVWYSFVAQATTHTITVVESADFDAVIEARTGVCMGTSIICINTNANGGVEVGNFNNLVVGTTYFLRVYHSLLGSSSGSFQICITHTAPTCSMVNGFSTSAITSTSATLNWASGTGGSSNTFNVKYKKTTNSTWTTVTATSNSKAITGLSPATAYHFQVQRVCGGNSTSNYSSSTTFTTLPSSQAPSNNICSNATQLTVYGNTCGSALSGTVNNATQSYPPANCNGSLASTANDVWYKFVATSTAHKITVVGGSTFDGIIEIRNGSCSGTSLACSDLASNGQPEILVINTLTVGNTYYVRVYDAVAFSEMPEFTICVTTTAPACSMVNGLSTSAITSTSATLNWALGTGGSSNTFNVKYKKTSNSTWTTVTATTNSKAITGLTPGTAYHFQVQRVCGGTSNSNYSSSTTFTTLPSSSSGTTVTISTGTSTTGVAPYGTANMDERVQFIITKSELVAGGYTSATNYIKSLAFNVSSANNKTMTGFTIKMGHTTATSFSSTSFLTSSLTTVYSGNVTATSGWNTHTFNTSFLYNGSSNLLIQICWNNTSAAGNSTVRYTATTTDRTLYLKSNLANGSVCSTTTGGIKTTSRPNMRFAFSSSALKMEGATEEIATEDAIELVEEEVISMKVFPNPTADYATIEVDGVLEANTQLTVFDLTGKQVFTDVMTSNTYKLSVENYIPGNYLVIIQNSKNSLNQKLLVKIGY